MFVTIVGHSFVTRLQQYLDNTNHVLPPTTFFPAAHLSHIGVGGCYLQGSKFDSLYNRLTTHLNHNPCNVLFIELGTNDLDSGASPAYVATALYNLADHLQSTYNLRYVFIATIINRNSHQYPAFQQRARDANQAINSLVTHLANPHIKVWDHRNFNNPRTNILAPDGVHLNTVGLRRYWRSVRGAITYAAHH